LKKALLMHHYVVKGRAINVELTAGGGGNSAARKEKIGEKRKRVTEERSSAFKKKLAAEGKSLPSAPTNGRPVDRRYTRSFYPPRDKDGGNMNHKPAE
jgi:nucleolar protein 6